MSNDAASQVTFFDSPERTPADSLRDTVAVVAQLPLLSVMLEAFPTAALLLEGNRHIIAANARAVALFGGMAPADVFGLRLGEAFGCVCAHVMEAGCGTSPSCAECGAAHAIRTARELNGQVTRDCRIRISTEGKETAYDLRVCATPITIGGLALMVVAVEDVADEKRRAMLERIFFHDVLGAGMSAHGLARMVLDAEPAKLQEIGHALVRATGQMLEEIQAQRDLLLAERGQLTVVPELVSVNDVLDAVYQQYRLTPLADGRQLQCRLCDGHVTIRTDRVQLVRSLGNLVRNSLEAVAAGEAVMISAHVLADGVLFQVANPGAIPPNVQHQIFQRSFSTKAARGRGLGAYSVKLVVEQYLNGRVSFVSSDEAGTVFSVWLPSAPQST